MARNKKTIPNIDLSDVAKYPDGRIKDNTGAGNGTPVNEFIYGDMHEFFAKLMRLYAITYNGLPDNETNGYQLIAALQGYATKNSYMHTLTSVSASRFSVPVKLNQMQTGEILVCKAASDRAAETQLIGSQDSSPAARTITFIGGSFKQNDYLIVVKTAGGVDIVRIGDAASIDNIAAAFGYLKAATLTEERAGALSTKATSPLTNLTVFAERVIGASTSDPYLASGAHNGLMSAADKTKLDGLGGSNDRYGTIVIGDVNTVGHPVGYNFTVSGQVSAAQVTAKSGAGEQITVTINPGMADTNYLVRIFIESLGTLGNDDDIRAIAFKKISATQFVFGIEQTGGVVQNIKAHIEVIQK